MVELSPPIPPAPCTWATPRAACWETLWPACCKSPVRTCGVSSTSTTRATRSKSSPESGGPYFQIIKGEDAVEFPEDGYHGDDIRELAQAFYENEGDKYLDCDEKNPP